MQNSPPINKAQPNNFFVMNPRTGETQRYNPHRDLAYLGPGIIRGALEYLGRPGVLSVERMRALGIDMEALCAAAAQLGKFLTQTQQSEVKDVEQAMAQSGLLPNDDTGRTAVGIICEVVGQIVLGSTFNAVRDVSMVGTPMDCSDIVAAGLAAAAALREQK